MSAAADSRAIRLGLAENLPQFLLLMAVNALVGGMVGLERTVAPLIGAEEFHIASTTVIVSFIVSFGVVKAFTNLFVGHFADRYGRKHLLVLGWLIALPVPFMIMWAPGWGWIVFANALLGVSQGLTWSAAVIMKIDLVGPRSRGLAVGLNEFAGYFALAATAFVSGYIAQRYGLRPAPFYLGIVYGVLGTALSVLVVRDTRRHVQLEAANHAAPAPSLSFREVFRLTSIGNRNLFAASQAGLVNNLNDGMSWGIFPLYFAAFGASIERIGVLKAAYPAVWSILQTITGPMSDRWGRKGLIVAGMWVQAIGLALTAASSQFGGWLGGSLLLGVGTAMVYPSLLAVVSDVAHPSWRARALSVYRFWRDLGYAIGALSAGLIADFFGLRWAIAAIAVVTFLSGTIAGVMMQERNDHDLSGP
jgi:MFS family permease